MGSFGLKISKTYISPPAASFKANNQPRKFVVRQERGDSLWQKSLAYSSYYTLVFVSFCMMMPARVASAADLVSGILG